MRHVLLVVACALALYPIFFMVTTAFKTRADYLANPYSLPWPISFGNFSQALEGGAFATWFKNSVVLTLGSVILSTAFAALAAFAVARMRWPGRHVFLSVNVALMVVPPVVMLIPLFIFFTDLHLVSTYQGVILIYAGLTLPFSVYLTRTSSARSRTSSSSPRSSTGQATWGYSCASSCRSRCLRSSRSSSSMRSGSGTSS